MARWEPSQDRSFRSSPRLPLVGLHRRLPQRHQPSMAKPRNMALPRFLSINGYSELVAAARRDSQDPFFRRFPDLVLVGRQGPCNILILVQPCKFFVLWSKKRKKSRLPMTSIWLLFGWHQQRLEHHCVWKTAFQQFRRSHGGQNLAWRVSKETVKTILVGNCETTEYYTIIIAII